MNTNVVNQDISFSGIYRAKVYVKGDEAVVYAPGLSSIKLSENNELTTETYEKYKKNLPKGLFISMDMKNSIERDKWHTCWVMFENGDGKRPIITGYYGLSPNKSGQILTGGSSFGQTPNGPQNDTPPPEVSSDVIKSLLWYAESKLGCPYAYGQPNPRSTDPNENKFDCSGYIYWCYGQINVKVGTNTAELIKNGTEITNIDDRQPGDLIVWSSNASHGANAHVVMVYDYNTMIHCGAVGDGTSCVNKRNIQYAINRYNERPIKSVRRIVQVSDNAGNNSDAIVITLNNIINTIDGSSQGQFKVSYYFKNLRTGEVLTYNSKESLYAASLIKLFVMAKVYDCINEGQLKEDNVSNDLNNMITISDNEATNRLTTLIGNGNFNAGASAVTDYAKSLGCTSTIFRNALGAPNIAASDRNVTSTADCANILDKIYNKNLVSSDSSNKMLELLKAQKRTNKIPAGVPNSAKVANKTGETTYADNDAAIVFTNNDRGDNYIFTVMIQDFNNPSGGLWVYADKIKQMSENIYNYVTK